MGELEEESTDTDSPLSKTRPVGSDLSIPSSDEAKPLVNMPVPDDNDCKNGNASQTLGLAKDATQATVREICDDDKIFGLADGTQQATFPKASKKKRVRRRLAHRERGVPCSDALSSAETPMFSSLDAGEQRSAGSTGAWSITELENKLSKMKVESISSGRGILIS